jgi:tetratricopeptide (TPR) repeat protein
MFDRKLKVLHPSAAYRWLSAIALVLILPVGLQAQVGRTAQSSADFDSDAPTASVDRPRLATRTAQEPRFTAEQEGDRLRMSGHYQAANQAYAQIPHPSALVWNKMGISYQMLYDLKEAMRCYKESLKLQPANPFVLNNLGTVQELLGSYSAAERNYRKALKLVPNDTEALRNLGTNLIRQGEYDRGADAYKQALAINPHILDDHFGPQVEEPLRGAGRGASSYIKARSCAEAGLTDCALTYLERAFDEGSATVQSVASEADFASLRGTPELARLIAEQK